MKALDILNSEALTIQDKLSLLTRTTSTDATSNSEQDLQTYIDYYKGKQAILDRIHPTDIRKTEALNKLVFNMYKMIAQTANFFLFGEDPEPVLRNVNPANQVLFDEFKQSYNEAKTEALNQQIGVETFALGQSAEMIYVKDGKIKYAFLSVQKERFYPFFDEKGDLDSIVRRYEIEEFDSGKIVVILYHEIYTPKQMYRIRSLNNQISYVAKDGTLTDDMVANYVYKEIPIVYYSMEQPIPWEVKTQLDRYNLLSSTIGDVNDYFAFPMLKMKGYPVANSDDETEAAELKRNTPNVIQLDNETEDGQPVQADVDYLVWSNKPESAIFELKNLKEMALYLCQTPDISLENLKNLSSVSGIALKLMFLNAIAATKMRRNVFFSLQRRINLHKALMTKLYSKNYNGLDIYMQFKEAIPENIQELIANINSSVASGTLSIETAVERHPYVMDSTAELENLQGGNAESFNL